MEWIAVSERLPEEDTRVIIWPYLDKFLGDVEKIVICASREGNIWYTDGRQYGEPVYLPIKGYEAPTHWTLLEPPE